MEIAIVSRVVEHRETICKEVQFVQNGGRHLSDAQACKVFSSGSNYFIIRWTLIVLFHFENRQLSLPNSVLYFAWSVRIDFLFVIRVSFFLALVSILPFCCSKFNFCLQCGCQFYSLRKSHYFFSRFNFCVVTSLSFLRYVM